MSERTTLKPMSGSVYRAYVIASKTYWRTASVVMACHACEHAAPNTDRHWFDASWERRWWGGKVLTIRECFQGTGNER